MESLLVDFHPSVTPWEPEAAYALRTILRTAGYGCEISVADASTDKPDIYYGPDAASSRAWLRIPASGRDPREAALVDPLRRKSYDGWPTLDFGEGSAAPETGRGLTVGADLLYAAYWLLSGIAEPRYARDARDNHRLAGQAFAKLRLWDTPFVSVWALRIRELFEAAGRPAASGWVAPGRDAALCLTHDVDYPEMIRWIEALRALRHGPGGPGLAVRVLRGKSDFWRFDDWVELAADHGGVPTFYFLARQGSLMEYVRGTPDGFYDVTAPRYRQLLAELLDQGCEIGLHPSYHAYQSGAMLAGEVGRLESVADARIEGARHHYWHLDPEAPAETLKRLGDSGLGYDSSLAFEFYPGFRRGICHPFHPYDPDERRELPIVEIPPTWMDDHFDRRRRENGIEDPDGCAAELLAGVRETGGVAVLDYHVRGMNTEFFPRYGSWIRAFLKGAATTGLEVTTPAAVARRFLAHARATDAVGRGPGAGPISGAEIA